MNSKKILLVGGSREIYSFSVQLKNAGFTVDSADNPDLAYEKTKEMRPDAAIFIHLSYWEAVGQFAEKIRKEKGCEHIKILYLSSEIEGNDQPQLQKFGVRTFTLGPVPEAEVIRFIKENIS